MTTLVDSEGTMRSADTLLDTPIESAEADLLGFRHVAESLTGGIKAQPNGSSLTIGLDGPWGSGKSSILGLLRQALENDADANADMIGTVVVPFSPWLITNRTALVSAFFAQISTAIGEAEKRVPNDWYFIRRKARKTLAKTRTQLNKFSRFASLASTTASALDPTFVSAAASGGINAVKTLTDDTGKPGKTLETLKQELTRALQEIAEIDPSFRVLVLIDDLDRLDPGDALEVLRLVKAVGDFPATTYLLAYDRAALARAIEHSTKIDNGDSYLEKIIQFSFKVPPLEPFQLRNWLRSELIQLFPKSFDQEPVHASAVLDVWAGRLLSTPRDVKRLLFAVRALWTKLEGRVDLLDLIWVQMIAQKAADKDRNLYSWLVGYLQALEAVAIGGRITGKDDDQENLVSILKALGWREFDHGKQGQSVDFHHLDQLLAGVSSSYLGKNEEAWTYKLNDQTLQQYREARRLSSPWHWRLYFALDFPSYAVTDEEWQVFVQAAEASVADLSKALATALEIRSTQRRDIADQIIGRASHAVSSGKLAHAGRWITAIVKQAEAMQGRSRHDSVFGFSKLFESRLKSFAQLVFTNISGPDRKEALTAIFKESKTLWAAANLLRDQYHASKKEGNERKENYYLSDEELADISKSQKALFETLTPSGFRELPRPYDILYAWKDIAGSSEGPARLLTDASKEDGDFLKTLSVLRYVSSSAQNGVPHIPEGFLRNFVDTNSWKDRLQSLADGRGEYSKEAAKLLKLWWKEN